MKNVFILIFLTIPALAVFSQNIGIDVPDPNNKLDISNSARTGTHSSGRSLYVTGNLSPSSNGIEFRTNDGTQGIGLGSNTIYAAGSNTNQDLGLLAKGSSGIVKFSVNGLEFMRITPGGVGIKTVLINEEPFEVGGSGRAFFGNGAGSERIGLLIDGIQGTNAARLEAYDYGNASGRNLVINTVGDGNVGIGTESPTERLHVTGNVRIDGLIVIEDYTFPDINPAFTPTTNVEPRYYMDKQGIVHIEGSCTAPNQPSLQVIFELPEGYRPSHYSSFLVPNAGSFCQIAVFTNGWVVMTGGTEGYVRLDGIDFRAVP